LKTLYISDLDGTLLDKQAEVTAYTANALNALIARGVSFSVASARTSETAVQILKNVNLSIPLILMNGVCVFDPIAQKFIDVKYIPIPSVNNLLSVLNKHHQTGFLYGLADHKIDTYYENLDSPQRRTFYEERVNKYYKRFTKVSSFGEAAEKNIIYFSFCEKQGLVAPLYNELKNDTDIRIEYYRDIYIEDFWYLEVCAKSASKFDAVEQLRRAYGFDQIVGFGDNLNDLPLFAACDESYAVANAKPEVKEKATAVIGSNDSDGVAKWLIQNAKTEG